MPSINRLTTAFIHYVLPRFPVMLPQAANNLFWRDCYFQYLITVLNELFITLVQIRTSFYGFSLCKMQSFVSRQIDNCYVMIFTELQLWILTSFLWVCLEFILEYLIELALWKQVNDIKENRLIKCLQFLPEELIRSIKQCMEILTMEQRKRDLKVEFLLQSHLLSTDNIRERLYKELYHPTAWKDVGSAFPGSSVNNISELLKMGAEIDFLWPLFSEVMGSVNIPQKILNIADLLGKLINYITRSQSGSFPDRMECNYLFYILQVYYASKFTVARMVYKMKAFTCY
ncbi:hypothetical protein GGI35DRAFT_472265 [Trichoderma velutinum]